MPDEQEHAEPTVVTEGSDSKAKWLRRYFDNHSAVVATLALIATIALGVYTIGFQGSQIDSNETQLANQSAQLSNQSDQISLQSQQLSLQSQQFDSTVGKLTVEVKVGIRDGAADAFNYPIRGQITDSDIEPGKPGFTPYVLADVTNVGQYPVGVKQVGIRATNSPIVSPDSLACTDAKPKKPSGPCQMPLTIGAQQTAAFIIPLDPIVKASVNCYQKTLSESTPNIQFAISTQNGPILWNDTGASIYWFSQCVDATTSAPTT